MMVYISFLPISLIFEDEVAKIKKEGNDLVYLNQLFGILEEKEVNLTCAGYFAKVATAIFSKNPAQVKFISGDSSDNIMNSYWLSFSNKDLNSLIR